MEHPWFISIAQHVLGERFIMQIFQCPFHLDGIQVWPLHLDSWWMPPPQRKSALPRLRVGSVTVALQSDCSLDRICLAETQAQWRVPLPTSRMG